MGVGVTGYSIMIAATLATACAPQPARKTPALVKSIAPYEQPKFGADLVMVTAQAPDGRTGFAYVNVRRLRCKVGDIVDATEQGVTLTIEPHSCR